MTKILSIFRNAAALVLLAAVLAWSGASAGYSSIYVFGDGVCTTTQNPPPAPSSLYFGARFCNGPVWIEKLSEQLGITYDQNKNISYFQHHSVPLVTNTNNLSAPEDAATSIFIVWSSNADFVKFVVQDGLSTDGSPATQTQWDNVINQAVANQVTAVTTLYNKGARTVVLMHAVDLMRVPEFNFYGGDKAFVSSRVSQFNDQLAIAMGNLQATKDGLNIIMPDVFAFTNGVLDDPAAHGMIDPRPDNAAIEQGFSDPFIEGANFVFWDPFHPTAKFQATLANFVNGLIPALDDVPPVLTLPGNLVKASTGPEGAVVTFVVSAEDAVDGPVTATALPASGSLFPIGTTTVNVSASDAAGNEAGGSFKVTVVDPANLLNNVTITPAGAGSPAISGSIQGGPPGGEVILQASTDLGITDAWRDLSVIQLDETGGQIFGPIHDPQGAGLKRDFFRIKLSLSP